jgi:hypothetical protein
VGPELQDKETPVEPEVQFLLVFQLAAVAVALVQSGPMQQQAAAALVVRAPHQALPVHR